MRTTACKIRRGVAFTLLELLIVLAVVAILTTMLFPVYAGVRKRAQRVQSVGNLHGLYVAADLFLQRNGSWPQISRGISDTGEADFAGAWIVALSLRARPGSARRSRRSARTRPISNRRTPASITSR